MIGLRVHPAAVISSIQGMEKAARLDHAHLWHPFTQQRDWVEEEPLMVEGAEGTELIDSEGGGIWTASPP